MEIKVEEIVGIKATFDAEKNYVVYEIIYQTEWDRKNNVFSATIIHRDKEKLKEARIL